MLNLGWSEFFFIIVIAALVIGPEEIPAIMRNLGRVARRLHYLKFALSQQFEDFLKEHDLHDLKDLRHEVNFETPNHQGVEFHEAEFDEEAAALPPVVIKNDL